MPGSTARPDLKHQTNKKDDVSGAAVKSNLTAAEQRGMKSLQERVRSGELVVTETDKSRRFCVMTRSQYRLAGEKHTSKDMKIEYDQLQSIQKLVNDHSR